jgi:hypothetical protein
MAIEHYIIISGNNNIANSYETLYQNRTGDNNIANGYRSLFENIAADNNIAYGNLALNYNTTGQNNIAYGQRALETNTSGNNNIFYGRDFFLGNNITGDNNIAYGTTSLDKNENGNNNIGVGYASLSDNISGEYNIAYGISSLSQNTEGNNNVAFGRYSLSNSITNNNNNIAIGPFSLLNSNPGQDNTAIGAYSLSDNYYGSQNTGLGSYANTNIDNADNATVIGNGATIGVSNRVRIGNTGVTAIVGQVAFTTSDGRFKTNVQNNVPGLDFIVGLRPVTYHFEKLQYSQFVGEKQDENYVQKLKNQDAEDKTSTGFIAQEVEALAQKFNYDFDGVLAPQNEKDSYYLGYQQFVVPLVKAIQELNGKNKILESKLVMPQTANKLLYVENDLQLKQINQLLAVDAAQQILLLELQNEIQQLKAKNK